MALLGMEGVHGAAEIAADAPPVTGHGLGIA